MKTQLLKYIIIGLILVLPSWGFGADQNIYLDNAGAGAGSEGDPYGAFAEINWTTGGANSIFDWVAGDHDVYINLKKGVTWRDQQSILCSGVSGHPITIQAYSAGADPIISGSDIFDGGVWAADGGSYKAAMATETHQVWYDGTYLTENDGAGNGVGANEWDWVANECFVNVGEDPDTGSLEASQRNYTAYNNGYDYITIDGLTFKHSNSDGIYLNNTQNITVQNCDISYARDKGIVIATDADDQLIYNNTIHHNGLNASDNYGCGIFTYKDAASSGHENYIRSNTVHTNADYGIYINSSYYIIEYNKVYDNGNISGMTQGIELMNIDDDGYGANIIVRYNIVYGTLSGDNDGSGIAADDHTSSVDIYGNVCYNNDGPGVGAWRSNNINIYNNTCYGNGQDSGTSHSVLAEIFVGASGEELSNIVVKNNVTRATEANSYAIYCDQYCEGSAGLDISNNNWYATQVNWYFWNAAGGSVLATWNGYTGVGTDFNDDPLFTNAAGGDFTLQATSPCIDAGTDLGASYDDGLDPDSSWPTSVTTLDHHDYGPGEVLDTFPTGATAGSLASNSNIVIDVTAPAIDGINNTDALASSDATYTTENEIIKFVIETNTLLLEINAEPDYPRILTTAISSNGPVCASCLGLASTTDHMLYGFPLLLSTRDLDLSTSGDLDMGPGGDITDTSGNSVAVSMGALDLSAGAAIVCASHTTAADPWVISSDTYYTTLALIDAATHLLPDDYFKWSNDTVDVFDVSAHDGTSGHEINLNGQGYAITGNQTFGDYYIISRFIHGSTVTLGANDTHKYSLIPSGDILKIPEGATGCTIHDDGIRGTLDLDEGTLGAPIVDDDCADDDTGDWTEGDCTVAFDTDHYEVTYVADTQHLYRTIATLTEGKLYKTSIAIKDGTSANVVVRMVISTTIGATEHSTSDLTTTAAWVTHTFYFTSTAGIDTYDVYSAMVGAGDYEIKNIILQEATGVYNTWITTVDPTGLDADESVLFYSCAFVESQAVIEAKDADDDLIFDAECQFSITTANCFRDYAGNDFHLTAGSPLKDAGEDTGADTDLDGRATPRGAGYDIGCYELSGNPSMGLGLNIKGGFCPYWEE